MGKKRVFLDCIKGLIVFEDRFDLVSPKHVNWVCKRLHWHKILPLAAALSDPAKPKCRDLESLFQAVSLQNTIRETWYEKQIAGLFQTLTEASIDFIPFKGPFWGKQFYPSYSWKHIGDIDLLLTKENARTASFLLQKTGYIPDIVGESEEEDFKARGELALFPDPSRKNDVPVELHWEPFPSPRFIGKGFLRQEDFTENSTSAQWKGVSYRLPRPEIQFFYYALHATCQHQFMRFVHIMNLAHCIQKFPRLDWGVLYKLANQREALTPFYYCLKFINAFFPLPKPALTLMNCLIPSSKIRLVAALISPDTTLFATRKRDRIRRNLFRTAMSW